MCAPCGRNARSGAGFGATESSWRVMDFPGCARGAFAGEALGACASATVAATRKLSPKRSFRQAQQTHHLLCSLTLNLIFLARLRQTSRAGSFAGKSKCDSALQFIPQSLLMPVRLHAFATLVLGNFCFPSFFKRAHSDLCKCDPIESSNSSQRKCSRRCSAICFRVMVRLRLSSCPARRCLSASRKVRSIVCGPEIFRSTR